MNDINIVSKTTKVEKEVFLDYFLGSTPEEAEEVFYEFSDVLNTITKSYHSWSGLDKGDLFGTALVGLARAKRDFDPLRSDNFKVFVTFKVKNALNEYYRHNRTAVSIPSYVRIANSYINSIKLVLESRDIVPKDIQTVLKNGELNKSIKIDAKGREKCIENIDKLKRLSVNTNIPYRKILERSEYIPSGVSFDDTISQDELFKRECQITEAALIVSKLKDYMTDAELLIAEGIMTGKTYAEIGGLQKPHRTAAWVKVQLNKMRSKFKKKLGSGL